MFQTPRESPYQGLIPYDERDALYFFGREKETKLIAASLFSSPLTLIYGASGVGKSSLLRAGVVNFLSSRDDLLVIVFNQWQDDPLSLLKASVAEAAARFILEIRGAKPSKKEIAETIGILEADLGASKAKRSTPTHPKTGRSKIVALSRFLTSCAAKTHRRLMIILDQFEEYSMYHPNDDQFANEFPTAVMHGGLNVSFLISLREDSLAKLDRFEGRIPTLFDNYRRIKHLDRAAARSAIVSPLERYNSLDSSKHQHISIEPELVEVVLDQVRTGQVAIGDVGRGWGEPPSSQFGEADRIETPYLQLVLTRLWSEEMNLGSKALRLDTLNTLGGAEQIVQSHLDSVMEIFDDKEKSVAAQIFNLLVTPSGTKVVHTVSDLADYAGISVQQLTTILKRLASGSDRILRPVSSLPGRPDQPRYEIFHDRLAPAILDWRDRYLKEQELTKLKRIEAEKHRLDDLGLSRLKSRRRRVNDSVPVWQYQNVELFPSFTINDLLSRGKVIPVLGSDLITSDRRRLSPSRHEIADILSQEMGLQLDEEQADLATISSYYESKYGRRILYERLRNFMQTSDTSQAYSQLAYVSRQTPLLIITTSYDTAMEEALDSVGVKYDVVSTNVDRGPKSSVLWFRSGKHDPIIVPSYKLPVNLQRTSVIYKICGSVDRRNQLDDSYVITEEDYAELFGRIMHSAAIPKIFMEHMHRNHLLFIGMGARTWTQRVLVRSLISKRARHFKRQNPPCWSVKPSPTELEVIFWQDLDIKVYNEDINHFLTPL